MGTTVCTTVESAAAPTFRGQLLPLSRNPLMLSERAMGFEPTTYSLGSCHSTTELCPQRSWSLTSGMMGSSRKDG